MKPNFALTLSHDGIGLLHRGRDGWYMVGNVSLDDDAFVEKLGYLRQTAASLESGGVTTKLVIPNSQILYTTVDAPGPSAAKRHAQIRAALDGATPYDISDLAYDWCEVDAVVQVAAIARETLDEAEGFAAEHGFNPLSFVAIPDGDSFVGEPFFGVSGVADTLLEGTEAVEQDDLVIRILGPLEVPTPDKGRKTAPKPEITTAAKSADAPKKKPEPKKTTAADDGLANKKPKGVISAEMPDMDTPVPGAAIPAFSTRRKTPPAKTPDKAAGKTAQVKSRPATSSKAKKGSGAKAQKLDGVQRKNIPKPARKPAAPPVQKTTKPQNPDAASWNEKQAMTVFGARSKSARHGKPRHLGLPLMVMLFAVLGTIVLWSSFFLGDMATLWRGGSTDDTHIAKAGIAPDMAPDIAVGDALAMLTEPTIVRPPQPPAVTPTNTLAEPVAAAPIDTPGEGALELEPEPEPEQITTPVPAPDSPALPTPETALATYSDTGIWQLAPTAPDLPAEDGVEALYIASIDPEITSQDAVALPPVPDIANDYSLESQTSPAAHDTKFILDDRGLVIASLAGTLNPDGVSVFLGAPPVKPRARGDRVPQVIIVPNLRLAGFRPASRPENLAEQNETAQLGGRTRAELAALHPEPRPAAPKIEEERDETPTAQAITVSNLPKHRPRNFAKLVARARASAPTTTAVAVPQSPTITLGGPTRVSVARMATTKNAISLRRVSLIGVYGSPSDRRALVRLPSGRYVKVQVGQRVDGGKVAAIGEAELRYVKGGRTVVLKMPKS